MNRLNKDERKVVESYAKGLSRATYCAACGKEILFYSGMEQEQADWERKHHMHYACYQRKRREKQAQS